jgi:hypothetical protein
MAKNIEIESYRHIVAAEHGSDIIYMYVPLFAVMAFDL